MSVDDSPSVRQMVTFSLEAAGYQVATASDGQEALDMLKAQSADMVITDLNMPRMDGLTLIKELRALSTFKFTPIILLTTESQADRKEAGKTAGATGWIVKPFQQEQLLAVVKKVLG
jgi:two-component system chemotaxis response regulator CheY